MATVLRTENDTVNKNQPFTKVILADAGKKFEKITLKKAGSPDIVQILTDLKEHTVSFPAVDADYQIVVCQEDDIAPPPAKFRVRVIFNSAAARIQLGFGGPIYDGYGIFAGYPQYPPAGLEYTAGETFPAWISIKPEELAGNELFSIRKNGVFLPSVAGISTTLASFIVDQDILLEINTRPKNSVSTVRVTASISGNGTVSPANQTIQAGGVASLNISLSPGHQIKSITLNNQPYTLNYTKLGGNFVFNAIYVDTDIVIVTEQIPVAAADARNSVISWWVQDRLTGSDTQALVYDRSTFINTNIVGRVHKKNNVLIPNFSLPYDYTSDLLTLETTWDVGYTSIDEYIDSLNANYLRLALHSIARDGGSLFATTRLNNSYHNQRRGFTANQVVSCRLKVSTPDGVVLNYNHPVLRNITDLTHNIPLTVVGIYTLETETILAGTNLRTSYSKSFVNLIIE